MKTIVFCGPTLSPGEAERVLACEARPPAMRGDVLAAAFERPDVIAIVDGYFDRVPSIWHKEILWAMAQGIHVFGAASMGALRAAELAPFGMRGVGFIFESFERGLLTDDDEVAVMHADESCGFRRLSEAMVNIRATLRRARDGAIIDEAQERRLVAHAKARPYWERAYPVLLEDARRTESRAALEGLGCWLREHAVDQKLTDARELLFTIREQETQLESPLEPCFRFNETDAWSALYREVSQRGALGKQLPQSNAFADCVDELLLAGEHGSIHDVALARALAGRMSGPSVQVGPRAVESCVEEFRRDRGLLTAAQFEDWCSAQALSEQEFVAFFRREAEFRRAHTAFSSALDTHLVDQLRSEGRVAALQARAREKRAALRANGLDAPRLDELGISREDLWRWYRETRRGASLPPTLEAYAAAERVSANRLQRAVLREYCYSRLSS